MFVCPICQRNACVSLSGRYTDYLTQESFMLDYCHACGCAKTQGVSHSTQYYGESYYNSPSGKFSPLLEKWFHSNHRRNAQSFYKRFQPRSVLEIGCGRAYLLKELQQCGCKVSCLESAQASPWILNNQDIQVVIEQHPWPFEAEQFQMVIFWHVFEHLPHPLESLKQATRVLEKDQILCLSVPNISSYQARLNLATWFHLDVPRHLFHFSKKGLVELLERHHYEIIEVTSGDAIQNLYGWFQSLANLFTPHTPNVLYRFLQGGQPWQTSKKFPLLIQLVTSIFWVPLGLIGYFLEVLTKQHGTITIYAKKKSVEKSYSESHLQ